MELSNSNLEDLIITLSDEVKNIKKEVETRDEYIVDLRFILQLLNEKRFAWIWVGAIKIIFSVDVHPFASLYEILYVPSVNKLNTLL